MIAADLVVEPTLEKYCKGVRGDEYGDALIIQALSLMYNCLIGIQSPTLFGTHGGPGPLRPLEGLCKTGRP